jgi:choline dehydrogenase-like flavoprotein
MVIDASTVADGAELVADVCVIGAGPAGIAIAARLRGSGLRVCLLESGGLEPDAAAQDLYRGENVGHDYLPLHTCRFSLFGGTSNRWGGWCRPLDGLDFGRRDWVRWSGWPIGAESLAQYYDAAAALLELPTPQFDVEHWRAVLPEPFALGDDEFENMLVQFSPQTNFGEVYGPKIFDAREVTTLLHATVTELCLDPGTARVGTARVTTKGGNRFGVRARSFVVATGGIENARLLLASRADRSAGLGNENDLVGRFFMEHLHVPAGHIVAGSAAADRSFYRRARYGEAMLRGFLVPTAAAQQRHRLLTCSIAVEPESYHFGTSFLGWSPRMMFGPVRMYRRLRRTRVAPAAERARYRLESLFFKRRERATLAAARVARARAGGSGVVHSLYFRTEQAPDPQSRVSLGDGRDRFGMPSARLDWRVKDDDVRSIVGWLGHLDGALRRAALGRVVMPLDGWEQGVIGGPHHMGTTRMSASASSGVVDGDCRVHSVDNLYVAGSSVFSTGGHANPTFTIVALALRLADHLEGQLGRSRRVRQAPVAAAARPARDIRVPAG